MVVGGWGGRRVGFWGQHLVGEDSSKADLIPVFCRIKMQLEMHRGGGGCGVTTGVFVMMRKYDGLA
jgi:hypothetical protein